MSTNENAFSAETLKFMGKLDQFSDLLKQAKEKTLNDELKVSFQKSMDKVEALKASIQSGKLKIALVGAFSDGKTSTVAGFLGHADSNMKIAEEESSDEVIEYAPQNIDADVPPCVFVDTPGLFGQKFSSVTENYISEAHVILYIVAATNPLKDSHKETVAWLMNKLKKFDNTIFVINRMDDVCDYTDPDDFAAKEVHKKNFLVENVSRFCGLDVNSGKIKNLNIVCISSDPEGKGLQDNGAGRKNYWLTPEKREQYEKYSRMQNLRDMVNSVVKEILPQKLIQDTALTAIIEESKVNLQALDYEQRELNQAVIPETKNTVEVLERDLNNACTDLKREIRPCREELLALERRIVSKIDSSTPDTLQSVVDDEIGSGSAYKLEGNIQDILKDHFEGIVSTTCQKIQADLDVGSKNIDAALGLVKGGAGLLKKADGIDKAMIFAGRDLLGKVGIAIKFKPWGAVKLANFAGKTLPVVGAAVSLVADVAGIIMNKANEEKFRKAQLNLKQGIQDAFKDIYLQLNDESIFFQTFAPQVYEIENQIDQAKQVLLSYQENERFCSEVQKKMLAFWKGEDVDLTFEKKPLAKDKYSPSREEPSKKGFFASLFGRFR